MEKRVNQGYEIINMVQITREHDSDIEVVMGYNPKAPQPFVTWSYYPEKDSYEHGHYFVSKENALRDMFERGMDKVDLDLREIYRKETAIADMDAALGYGFKEDAIEGLLNNDQFLSRALHGYYNIDHSAENDALRDVLEDLYDEMVRNHEILDFHLMEIIEEAQENNPKALSIELKDGKVFSGRVYFNPKSSITQFTLELEDELIKTNMGAMPVEDYLDIVAYQQGGFSSYEEAKKSGFDIPVSKEDVEVEKSFSDFELKEIKRICLNGDEVYSCEKSYELSNDYNFGTSLDSRINEAIEGKNPGNEKFSWSLLKQTERE